MAEKEVCADPKSNQESSGRVEEVVEKTEGPVTTTQVTTTRVTSQQISKKPMSPFAKFRQLDKQNSLNTSPGTPRTPKGSAPLFKFTDPELNRQAMTVKERLLQWCQMKTKEYENVQLDNFSSSWADGLAFCALIHHFLPDAFDYHALTPKERRHNFTLAFRVADEKADIVPLLDVDDMVATRKPDWKCVFTYVQTIYARFKNED
uniref:Calponin-homology (CH) domain-containing protein n=2 Tax=Photinus pyralis TaxID=7054 RepID=A0A1Y1MAS7_PHOPY